MNLKIIRMTDFFDAPGGEKIADRFPGDLVAPTGNSNGSLIEVVLESGEIGWIAKDDCAPDTGSRPAADRGFFVDTCINVEQAFNDVASTAPWYVSADFMIARALLETKIVNVGAAVGSDAVGPLLVSSKEWQRFLTGADASLKKNCQPGDFDHWLKQIFAAAYSMSADAKAISGAMQKAAGVGGKNASKNGSSDPFLPDYLNLLHAYYTNADTAAALIVAINDAAAKAKPVSGFFTGLDATQTTLLFANRSASFGTALQPKTVTQFFDATAAALDQALKDAFGLIEQLAPEEMPPIKQGEAPWFDVALQAEAAHISEADNPRVIEGYFAATDLGRQTKVLNWCGAFVAHCMKDSGNAEAARSIPKGAAAAVNWGNFWAGLSVRAEDVPLGAVVLLSPSLGTNTTGHVGFCVQFLNNGNSIQLLGGNQSRRVQRSTFPATRIRAIRWLDLETSNVRSGFDSDPSKSQISQQAFDLIVFFEVSSQALYDKKYRKPTWPGESSGATIGIGYDVGYATRDQLRSDWSGKIADPMIADLEAAIGVRGAAAAPLARQLGATVDVPFEAAISVHRTCVLPRWVRLVERALPNCNLIGPDCLGALVSLAYNRGASFSLAGTRYAEMRDIKSHMTNKEFRLIPDDFRHMKRLWPNSPGLRDRREKEAALFERGLASLPVA
jgi:uncharacterized protein (TIGR02594 family)